LIFENLTYFANTATSVRNDKVDVVYVAHEQQ